MARFIAIIISSRALVVAVTISCALCLQQQQKKLVLLAVIMTFLNSLDYENTTPPPSGKALKVVSHCHHPIIFHNC